MVTGVVDEYNTHDTIQVIGVLTINRDTSFVLECLSDTSLEKILIKFGKKQCVEWSLSLLEGVKVKVVTHLIYSRKKNSVDIKC